MLNKIIKILLVEGFTQDIDFISICLPLDKGFSIDVVNSLEAAVKKIYENRYACILIDLFIDEEFVLSAVEKIRDKTARIPIIVMSNVDDEKMALKVLKKGAHDYFLKKDINNRLSLRELLSHADEFMYEAKETVKNEMLQEKAGISL